MRVGRKFDAFIDHEAPVEFLEGVTAAGKTTVGIYKFMMNVADSRMQQHIIAGLDTGTIEKNIIDKDHGILDEWGALVDYKGRGTKELKLPHILFHVSPGNDKKILVLGYDDKKRWKKALGGQYGCLYIDEINIADMDFVREASMRCDYLIGTLNPDDPALPVYNEYINHSRPLPEWAEDTPPEILRELIEDPKEGWTHWFFNFEDNIALSAEKIARIKENVPQGTKLWKNKILGLRGRATGLVFSNFDPARHVKTESWLRKQILDDRNAERYAFRQLSSGLDTSYSAQSDDTVSMTFQGITKDGTLYILEEQILNNSESHIPFAPSDIAQRYFAFLENCARKWGMFRDVFVDSADQATITELLKYKRAHPNVFVINGSYKTKIIDRINLQLGWLETGHYQVLDHCTEHIRELETYSYTENGEPEDGHDHTINSNQYGWIPYQEKIG